MRCNCCTGFRWSLPGIAEGCSLRLALNWQRRCTALWCCSLSCQLRMSCKNENKHITLSAHLNIILFGCKWLVRLRISARACHRITSRQKSCQDFCHFLKAKLLNMREIGYKEIMKSFITCQFQVQQKLNKYNLLPGVCIIGIYFSW